MPNHSSHTPSSLAYVLPEDSQFRLQKLHDHMLFLARLAEPRTWDEGVAAAPEISMNELAVCMELLAEQTEQVLDEVSNATNRKAAKRTATADARAVDESASAATAPDTIPITRDQVDVLAHLIHAISTQRDAGNNESTNESSEQTASQLERAILDGAETVRSLLDQMEAQQPMPSSEPPKGVREERAVYRIEPLRVHRTLLPDRSAPALHLPLHDMPRSSSSRWH